MNPYTAYGLGVLTGMFVMGAWWVWATEIRKKAS